MANSTAFQATESIINKILENVEKFPLTDIFLTLEKALVAIITVQIIYKGYQVMAGRSNDPVRELVWDIARKLLILTFVLNLGSWLTMAKDALQGLYEIVGMGESLYAKLDGLVDQFLKVYDSIVNVMQVVADDAWIVELSMIHLYGFFTIIVFGICFFIIVLPLFLSTVRTTLLNTLLILLLPVALFCFMWEQTKGVFSAWCNAFLGNLLNFLLLSIIINVIFLGFGSVFDVSYLQSIKEAEQAQKVNWGSMCVSVIIMTSVFALFKTMVESIANTLGQTNLEASTGAGVGAKIAGVGTGLATIGAGWLGNKAGGAAGGSIIGAIKGFKEGGVLGALKGAAKGGYSGAKQGALGGAGSIAKAAWKQTKKIFTKGK